MKLYIYHDTIYRPARERKGLIGPGYLGCAPTACMHPGMYACTSVGHANKLSRYALTIFLVCVALEIVLIMNPEP